MCATCRIQGTRRTRGATRCARGNGGRGEAFIHASTQRPALLADLAGHGRAFGLDEDAAMEWRAVSGTQRRPKDSGQRHPPAYPGSWRSRESPRPRSQAPHWGAEGQRREPLRKGSLRPSVPHDRLRRVLLVEGLASGAGGGEAVAGVLAAGQPEPKKSPPGHRLPVLPVPRWSTVADAPRLVGTVRQSWPDLMSWGVPRTPRCYCDLQAKGGGTARLESWVEWPRVTRPKGRRRAET